MTYLRTARLELEPISLPLVEAIMEGRREDAERFAEAVDCAKQAIDFNPSFPDAHGTMTSAAAHLGRVAEASAGLDGLLRLLPGLTLTDPRLTRPFRRQTDRDRFLAGLRKAGLPESSSPDFANVRG